MNLRNLCGGVLALALALGVGPAYAQRTPLYQHGRVLPNAVAKFDTQGGATDAGGISGDALGNGLNPHAAQDNGGKGLCSNSVKTLLPYEQACIGHDADGNAIFSIDSHNGLADKGLFFDLNGVRYGFPGPGNGNVMGPDVSTNNLPSFNGVGTLLRDSGFAASAIGGYGISQYGANTLLAGSDNTTDINNAAIAAHNAGQALVCDVIGTIQIAGTIYLYPFDHMRFVPGCKIQLTQDNTPGIQTVDAVGNAWAQTIVPGVVIDNPNIGINGKKSPAILGEGCIDCEINYPAITGGGSGTWTYTDGHATNATYPVFAFGWKGVMGYTGSFQNKVRGGYVAPAVNQQGIGYWCGTSYDTGLTANNCNANTMDGTIFHAPTPGALATFDMPVKISAGSDNVFSNIDGSGWKTAAIQLGGDNHVVRGTHISKLYAEAAVGSSDCAVKDDGTGSGLTSDTDFTWASNAGTTKPYCRDNGSTGPHDWVLGQTLRLNMYDDTLHGAAPSAISNLYGMQVVPKNGVGGFNEFDSFNIGSHVTTNRRNGDSSLFTAVVNGNDLGSYDFGGYDGGHYYAAGRITGLATEDWHTSVATAGIYTPLLVGTGFTPQGGTGGTNGACTVTLVGGTAVTPAQFSGTVSGGTLTGALTVAVAGDYTATPNGSGAAVTGCGLTGARVNVTFATLRGGARLRFQRTVPGTAVLTDFLGPNTDGSTSTCNMAGTCGPSAGDGGFSIPGKFKIAGITLFDANGHPAAGGGIPGTATSCGTSPGAPSGRDALFDILTGSGTVNTCSIPFGIDWGGSPKCFAQVHANINAWAVATSSVVTVNFASSAPGQTVTVRCQAAVL